MDDLSNELLSIIILFVPYEGDWMVSLPLLLIAFMLFYLCS